MSQSFAERFGSIQLAKENPNLGQSPKFDGNIAQDAFWEVAAIDETRWDQSFPFQLLVLKHEGKGKYSRIANGTFTLPIPPQALQISTPFAITTSVTLGGIVEEHNGAPLKIITLQGTTGVLPGRGSGPVLKSFNATESIFAGTVRAGENLKKAVAPLTANRGFASNTVTNAELAGALKGTTGYYQFVLLSQFLEAYVNMKKRVAGRNYRLAFAHWKMRSVYLVTPMDFGVSQVVGSPLEYTFNLSMKAWRRVNLAQGEIATSNLVPIARRPGALQELLKNVDDARRALNSLKDVLDAVSQDLNAVLFEPLRSTSLFVKDALGVPVSAADLPVNVVRDMKSAILEVAGIPAAVSALGPELAAKGKSLQRLSVSSGKAETGSGTNSGSALTSIDPDPANKILENPNDNYALFEKVKPGNLNLSPSTTRKIVEERERVRLLNRLDFEKMRDAMVSLLVEFSDSVGAGNDTYNRVYGRSPPTSTKTPTTDDFDAIFHLNNAILEMNRLAASGKIGDETKLDTIEYVAGLAGRSGIEFTVPKSKRQVPFPYGMTLERLSARYLGTPDRWHEIATLNRLREPFVDEVGFDLTLLVNGNGNKVVVSDASDLFVGQSVWISSSIAPRIKRRISDIYFVAEGNVVVTVDGDADLDDFTTMAGAQLHAFLPDTVNSQMLVFIPSDEPPSEEDFQGKAIPGLDEFENLLQVGGVDLLLTQDGDAAITPDGDWRLAVGLTNLVQRVRTFVSTPRGSLLRHPTYGLGIEAGQSTADISAQDLLNNIRDLFSFDPVFTGIQSASIMKQGPTTSMFVALNYAGSDHPLPITIDVKR